MPKENSEEINLEVSLKWSKSIYQDTTKFEIHVHVSHWCSNPIKGKHALHAHSEDESLQRCTRCEYSTHNTSSLESHYKTQHNKDKIYHCDQCGKSFDRPAKLEHHKKCTSVYDGQEICLNFELLVNLFVSSCNLSKTIGIAVQGCRISTMMFFSIKN